MNKIYTKVWNQSLHQFVVASELARNAQRLNRKPFCVKPVCIALSLLAIAMIPSITSHAQTTLSGTGSNSNNAQADSQCSMDFVDRGNPGNPAPSDGKLVRKACATAVGDQTYAAVGGVAIGYQANTTSGGVAVGSGARSQSVSSVAISVSALAAGNTSIAVGRQSAATGDYSIALGNVSYAQGDSSIALGHSAHATGYRSVAIGSGDSNNAASAAGSSGSSYLDTSQADAVGNLSVAIGGGSRAAKDNAVAIGIGARAINQNDIAIGTQSETSDLSSGPLALYGGKAAGKANSSNGSVSIGANDKERQLQHVAPGTITTTSTDAINGSQLYTVAAGTNALGQSIANSFGGDSAYNSETGQVTPPNLSTDNTDGTTSTYNNVADAFKAINNKGIKYFHSNSTADDSQARGTDSVAIGPKAVANNDNDISIGTASQSSKPSTGLTALYGGQAAGIANADNGSISVGAPNKERQIENVAAGTISAHSTDAINGSQLYSVSAGADSLGNSTANTLGGGSSYDSGSGKVSAPSYKVYNPDGTTSSVNNVGDALSAINTKGIKYFHSNSTDDDSKASGQNSVAIGPKAVANNERDVALGAESTTNTAVATASTTIRGTQYQFAGNQPTSTVSVGKSGAERTITNVAAGRLSHSSTDAVNGSQLDATNQAVSTLSEGSVQYDRKADGTPDYSNITLNPNNSSGSQIHNVAAGTADSDAANVGQLKSTNGNIANMGSSTASSLGGGSTYDPNTGKISSPSYTTYNPDGSTSSVSNVGDALNAINTKGIKYFHSNSTDDDSNASGQNSVAIGPKAVANNERDVALGAESTTDAAVATASTTIRGTQYQFAGNQPTSTVSVGKSGAERTITNVAAGRLSHSSTDAVNGSQLDATNQAVSTVSEGSVQYDRKADGTPDYSNITLNPNNSSGSQIHNVAAGTADSDAANVGQLKSTNGNIANMGSSTASSLGGGSTYDPNTGKISSPSYTTYNPDGSTSSVSNVGDALSAINTKGIKYFHSNSTDDDSKASGQNSVAIGPKAVANNERDVALGAESTTDPAVATASTTIRGTQYQFAGNQPTSTVSVGKSGAERTITNVAAGRLSHSSTDAVNGSQLDATNQAVSTLSEGSVQYDRKADGTPDYSSITLSSNNSSGSQIHNVAAGTADSDAANVGQLKSTNGNIANMGSSTASSLGGGSTYDPNTGKISSPSYTTYNPDGSTSSVSNVGDALNAINTKGIKYFHSNSTDDDSKASGQNSVAIGPKAQALHPYDIALGFGSTTEETVATKQVVIRGKTHTFAGVNPTSTVSVGAENNERTVTHVAAGRLNEESTDAVNGSQLYATNQAIEATSQNTAQLNQNTVQYDRNPDGSTNYESMTLNPNGSATQLHNVAAGSVSKNSSDGVNGAQLYAVENKISNSMQTHAGELSNVASGKTGMLRVNNSLAKAEPLASGKNTMALGAGAVANRSDSTALGNGAESKHENSVALGKDSATDRVNSVSLGTTSNRRQLTNLAAGTQPTDGANVGQVQEAKDWSKNYTDSRVNALGQDVNKFNHRANAGIASAIAAASLPQAYQPDQRTIAVGLGNFHGEAGIAVGVSNVSPGGHYIFKVNASTNSRGDAGIGIGAGLAW